MEINNELCDFYLKNAFSSKGVLRKVFWQRFHMARHGLSYLAYLPQDVSQLYGFPPFYGRMV